jgi:hypothetical protein
MQQQMCWLSSFGTGEQKILHLRTAPHEPWRPYTAFPQLAAPDYRIPEGSNGWATFHKLKQAGWVLISSATEKATEYQEIARTPIQ